MEVNGVVGKKLRIGFVLSRAFTMSAFALFVDTLRLASDERDLSGRVAADWEVLGSTGHLIRASCGVQLSPTSLFGDPTQFDYIVVVGGLLSAAEPIDDATVVFLKKASRMKVPLIGLCTGTFILAEAGLMKCHENCVSWLHYEAFRERFPDHKVRSDRLFNLDRTRGSCAGGSSAADLAAFIVGRSIGKAAERNALEVLQIERARSHADVQPRRPLELRCDDARLKAALIHLEGNTQGGLSVVELAKSVGLSRRQMERLFMAKLKMSPANAYRNLRMEKARRLLMNSQVPLIDIAIETGFVNASHFGRVFKDTYGKTPFDFRRELAAQIGMKRSA